MEESRITIVGAGPAGLALGLALSRRGVKSLILEKEPGITDDPRGVYLASDAIRILHDLGLGKDMSVIGHEPTEVQFHQSSFNTVPGHAQSATEDAFQQAVPTGILQLQPALEKALRTHIAASEHCELRSGCEVGNLVENDKGVELQYTTNDGTKRRLQTAWLIGADGKRGVVRKTFLEKIANIRQVDPEYRYTGTWIAANIHIKLPTPKTHPNFPPFASGMSPEEAYDLFWPKGWHFCSPPGKPTATGRFGPHELRLWRHEFAEEGIASDDLEGSERLFWEHLTPMITRTTDANGKKFFETAVWPRDTIEIMRCRPFTFTHKVVNRWFYKKCILIGDAAHVFPPFGGQGIATGICDAYQLAWRIAMLESEPSFSQQDVDRDLGAWSRERTKSIKDSAALTRQNALLCNQRIFYPFFNTVKVAQWVQWLFGLDTTGLQARAEREGFTKVPGIFGLPEHKGGLKMPQIFMDSLYDSAVLSDSIFEPTDSPLRLLVVVQGQAKSRFRQREYEALLKDVGIPNTILSPASTLTISRIPSRPDSIGDHTSTCTRKFAPTPPKYLSNRQRRAKYDVSVITNRIGEDVQYIIVRPDFYVFAAANDFNELGVCLGKLKAWLA